jgi:hypothetical protein
MAGEVGVPLTARVAGVVVAGGVQKCWRMQLLY